MYKYINKPEKSIMQALTHFPYLTVRQVTAFLYSPGSRKSAASKHLFNLFEKELVLRESKYSQNRAGGSELVYWLSTKGRNEIRMKPENEWEEIKEGDEGYDFTGWPEPKKMGGFLKPHTFEHYTVITDFLIAVHNIDDVAIVDLMHDLNLRRRVKQLHENIDYIPIPDGFVELQYHGQAYYIWLEVDMGIKRYDKERIQDKVWLLLEYVTSNGYQRDYGRPTPTFYFYCQTKERADQLLSWIENKLTLMGARKQGRWFKVGYGEINHALFTDMVWYTPVDRNVVTFLT